MRRTYDRGMFGMSLRRTRTLIYAIMFVMVAVEWTFVGAALFLVFMDFVESA